MKAVISSTCQTFLGHQDLKAKIFSSKYDVPSVFQYRFYVSSHTHHWWMSNKWLRPNTKMSKQDSQKNIPGQAINMVKSNSLWTSERVYYMSLSIRTPCVGFVSVGDYLIKGTHHHGQDTGASRQLCKPYQDHFCHLALQGCRNTSCIWRKAALLSIAKVNSALRGSKQEIVLFLYITEQIHLPALSRKPAWILIN